VRYLHLATTSRTIITTAPAIAYNLCRVHRLLNVNAVSPLLERSDRQASCQLVPYLASSAQAAQFVAQLVALAAVSCCHSLFCFIHA